jgi:ABC-2 type transport system permease protein
MNKILLVAKREYLTRIRNKTFILSTLLTPLFFVGVIAVSTYFAQKNSEKVTVAVYDESNLLFASKLKSGKNITYSQVAKPVFDSIKKGYELERFNGALHIPAINVDKPEGVTYISGKQLGIFSEAQVEDDLNDVLEQERMISAHIDTAQLRLIKKNPINLQQTVTSEDGATQASSGISYAVGYGSGILIYMVMFIYGAMVMRGVMEEKVNRIAEVIISSVKPMQLMMGKILGIGAVGLTQFLIWIVLMGIGSTLLGASMTQESISNMNQLNQTSPEGAEAITRGLQLTLGQLNLPFIVGMFLFYFITGYLFYASLFAAVGSAVNEDPQDAQSMMFPITIPIILSIVMMSSAIANPTGALATWCSIIPFTSPVIMMARLPFGVPGTVPYWQLGLSMVMMIIGIVFVTWLCARIYRTGILMYGKKPSWKEMLKWVFVKG